MGRDATLAPGQIGNYRRGKYKLNGAYTTERARMRSEGGGWKVDPNIMAAVQAVVPPGCSLVDLGAGMGHYVHVLREAGYDAHGVDGIPDIDQLTDGLVSHGDLSSPAWRLAEPKWDWAMCIEVGEHVPPDERSERFLDAIASYARDGMLVSWATPGQRGRRHVNCRPPEWVVSEMAKRGWFVDWDATQKVRGMVDRKWSHKLLVLARSDG